MKFFKLDDRYNFTIEMDELDEGDVADFSINWDQAMTRIRLNSLQLKDQMSNDWLTSSAFHEVLHMLLWELSGTINIALEDNDIIEKLHYREEHKLIRLLENVLLPVLEEHFNDEEKVEENV